jgi:hypothetical protein
LFKIDFMVEDKHLASVLRGVAGQVRDLSVVPVINAAPAPKGGVQQKHESSLDAIVANLKTMDYDVINADTMRKATVAAGYAPTSYSHFTQTLVKQGRLRKSKGGSTHNMTYELVK